MPTLETERLLLRPLELIDLDGFAAMMADEEVVRYLDGQVQDRAGAFRAMCTFLGHEQLRGWTNNTVIEKATGRFLGRCGLWQPEGWPGLEVGWTFARDAWGHGYASEAGAAWRDWCFAHLDTDELISVIHVDNVRSANVARRIGHECWREEEVRGFPCHIWGQRRP